MPIFEILETVSHFEDDLSRVTIVTKNNEPESRYINLSVSMSDAVAM